MTKCVEVMAIVEGDSESIFVKTVLAPYLAIKNIFIKATKVKKPGQAGGDVKFVRAIVDIANHLKQRSDTYVTTFVDYYGLNKDWPGFDAAKSTKVPDQIADALNKATLVAVSKECSELNPAKRFIPFVAVHEYEALLFSSPVHLAEHINVKEADILKILSECGEPERINDSAQTAPSKRLAKLFPNYKKTITGIAVAKAIGIETMREKCPEFNRWLTGLENLI